MLPTLGSSDSKAFPSVSRRDIINSVNRSSIRGFTLIELLVTISLTALLSSLVIGYSHVSRDQVTLFVEASKIAQTILRAKSLAISTYNQPTVPCGYGVEVDYLATDPTYALFSYDNPTCVINSITPAEKTEISRFSISTGLTLQIRPDSLRNVIFMPPTPNTLLSSDPAGSLTSGPVSIYLSTKDFSKRTPITVTKNGQVTF